MNEGGGGAGEGLARLRMKKGKGKRREKNDRVDRERINRRDALSCERLFTLVRIIIIIIIISF